MKRLALPLAGVLMAAAPIAVRAQFLPDQIAQRPAHEEFLRTAEIVRFEEIGEGVTKPYKLYLRKDGVELKAAWKNPTGQSGHVAMLLPDGTIAQAGRNCLWRAPITKGFGRINPLFFTHD
jgi:hypothetical protein